MTTGEPSGARSARAGPEPRSAARRLLVVSYHAPPDGAVGGLRWWGLSRHLARRGWSVHLLTAVGDAEGEGHPDGMTVEGLTPRPTLGRRYNRWRRSRSSAAAPADGSAGAGRGAGGGPEASGRARGWTGRLRALRRELSGLLIFPDHGRGWILRAARAVRRELDDFRPDIVVSTGPPHSVHLAVRLGVRAGGTRWIADFRDPWVDEARLHLDVAWAVPLVARLEAGVIGGAGRVLTTTPELAGVFRERYPRAPVDWLPNGVDVETLPRWNPDRSAGLMVVHLGTLYHRRDPIPAVRAFARFLRSHPDAATAGSKICFVGHVDGPFRGRVEAASHEEGISDRVEIRGLIPRPEALQLLSRSSVALILAQDQETAVPAKIYEAAGMRMPTLVITEPDSATGSAARRLGAAVHLPADLEGMAASLAAAWAGSWRGDVPPGVRVDYAELAEDAELLFEDALYSGARRDR